MNALAMTTIIKYGVDRVMMGCDSSIHLTKKEIVNEKRIAYSNAFFILI
jgi:hypothetical protein